MPWPRSTLSRREWASAERGVTILMRAGGGTVRVGGVRLTVWAAGQPAARLGEKKPKEHKSKAATTGAPARNAQPHAQRQAGAQPSARQQRSMRRLQEFQERKRAAVRAKLQRLLWKAVWRLRWRRQQAVAAKYWQERAARAAAPAGSTEAMQDSQMAEVQRTDDGAAGKRADPEPDATPATTPVRRTRARGSDLDPQAPSFAPGGPSAPTPQLKEVEPTEAEGPTYSALQYVDELELRQSDGAAGQAPACAPPPPAVGPVLKQRLGRIMARRLA